MTSFESVYPFTTENISGYMDGLNMSNKKVITVTGSGDHVINAILNGAKSIRTFDINPLSYYYMQLKLAAIKKMSFEEFLAVFLYRSKISFDSKRILSLPLQEETKAFFASKLAEYNNDGIEFKRSDFFHLSYFSPETTRLLNPYMNKKGYNAVKKNLKDARVEFVNTDISSLYLDEEFDYMFLSNISDYIEEMYLNPLEEYACLVETFLCHVKQIYYAYLYDIGNIPRGEIYNLNRVRNILPSTKIETFRSVFNDGSGNERDGVLILKRSK